MELYGRILGFLDRFRYSFLREAEWTPLENQYFSENIAEPRIEPGPLDV
jgi:hypothetical protein